MTKDLCSSRIAYPSLPTQLHDDDLSRLFTPTCDEVAWAWSMAKSMDSRHSLLTLLKVFQTLGRFVPIASIPAGIVRHVAMSAELPIKDQLRCPGRTLYRHHASVRDYLGVSAWDSAARVLVQQTIEQHALARAHPADLINAAIDVLLRHHIELPALSTLRRIASNVQQRLYDRMLDGIQQQLAAHEKRALDQLLAVPEGAYESAFAVICRPPGRATRKNLKNLVEHWSWLETFIRSTDALKGIPPAKVQLWSDEARRLTAAELAEYRAPRRYALLLSVLTIARGRLLDDLINMLTKIMRNLQRRSEAELEAWQAKRREASEQLVELLRDVVDAYQVTDEPIDFHCKASKILQDAGGAGDVLESCRNRLRHRSGGWFAFTAPGFRAQRSALMNLAEVLPLEAMAGASDLLYALKVVVACRSDRDTWIRADLDPTCLSRHWRARVRHHEFRDVYHRRTLEIAVFFELADALRSGDIYVPGSCSFGAYTEHLYPIEAERLAVQKYLKERGLPDDGPAFVGSLRGWLTRSIYGLERSARDGWVTVGREGNLIVPRDTGTIQPDSVTELEQEVLERLPARTILEALYNTDRWTRWTDQFGPPTRMAPQVDQASKRYILTSFAYGCGLGPTEASRHFKDSVPPHLMTFANRRHMGMEALRAASNDLINCYATFELPSCWGSGESAAADGTHVTTYDNNLFAAHHVRYGRTGGVAYRHIADNYIALFSHFIPCGVHEAVHILDGLLRNVSDIKPARLHADTHGQSTAVFALAYLLGIDLMPRIRNWRKLTLYAAGRDCGLCYTRHLYGGVIDWDLIAEHWEDYLRVVLAIQSGRVSASWILTRLNSYSRRNRLYLAFQELGRVVRTAYLIRWIEMDDLRRSVNEGTNKVETFHEFSGHLRFGSGGTLRTNDPDDQAKAIVYNELVANAVMLQTVADQTQVLHELHREGRKIAPKDVAYLSPYVTRHLKRFGDYPTHHETEPLPQSKRLP